MITLNYQLINNTENLKSAVADLSKYPCVGFDTETTSLDPYSGKLRLVQLATVDQVYVIDLESFKTTSNIYEGINPLKDLLSAPRPIKVAHNAKFDAKWLKHHLGIDLKGIFDTMLASQLIAAGSLEDRHSLEAVASRFIGATVDKTERMSDWSRELSENQLQYAARDASILLPLREKLVEKLRADELVQCATLEFECVMPVAQMELNGFYLDAQRWREQITIVEKKRITLADQLQEMLAAGSIQGSLFGRAEINLDSHVQLTDALKRLGVPVPDSTRSWKMQPLADKYPVIATLLEYRTVQKAITSYGENILQEINPVTKRIHANFHQIGAPTGRFACVQPNIQQIPHTPEYRRCFRAPENRKLVIADYSQIELRILADFTKDKGFIDAFNSGADLHRMTASQVFNVQPEDVTSDQRSFAKRLNFGVVYGIGAQRFALMTGISQTEAEDLLRRYFNTYRSLDAWLRESANRAVQDHKIRTLSGRLARFNFDPADKQAISMVQRNGKNTPIQGTSADILKRALRLLYDNLNSTSACLVNIVHDEIVVETNAEEAEDIAKRVEQMMVTAGQEYIKSVPIKVETAISDEWIKD
jgi:DNA polymerase I